MSRSIKTQHERASIVEAAKLLGFWIQPDGMTMLTVDIDGTQRPSSEIPSARHLEAAQRVICELVEMIYDDL